MRAWSLRVPQFFAAVSFCARTRTPFGHDRACSIENFLPQLSQVARMSCGHQPISEVKIIPEFLPRQLRAMKAMSYSAKTCPIPRCRMEAVFLLAP